jgi:hypothetical protein
VVPSGNLAPDAGSTQRPPEAGRDAVEVVLGQPKDLSVVEAIDVQMHLGNHLGRHVPTMVLGVDDPLAGRVGLALPCPRIRISSAGDKASVISRQ